MTIFEVCEGWTAPIDITLLSKGSTPSGTMTGFTVALVLRDLQGRAITTTGDVSVQDATNWVVRYQPHANDLVAGSYHGRIKVTDQSGGVSYFPSGEWDLWIVRTEG